MVGQQNVDIVDTLRLRDVAMATIFGFYICDAHWCQLANTTEPSMCGGECNAASCQIILTTCFTKTQNVRRHTGHF